MIIKFNRRSICMGDDAMNGIFKIDMPDDATVTDLVDVALHGGYGNTWPIPWSSYPWLVYSNIGVLARTADSKAETFFVDAQAKLSTLEIRWIYADAEYDKHEIADLEKKFR